MSLVQAGVDTTVLALWLGHAVVRSTQPYLHADLTNKEKALALVAPVNVKPGRYQPSDQVLAFLARLIDRPLERPCQREPRGPPRRNHQDRLAALIATLLAR